MYLRIVGTYLQHQALVHGGVEEVENKELAVLLVVQADKLRVHLRLAFEVLDPEFIFLFRLKELVLPRYIKADGQETVFEWRRAIRGYCKPAGNDSKGLGECHVESLLWRVLPSRPCATVAW